MTKGAATDRLKPNLYVLHRENLTREDFALKFGKGTIMEYLVKQGLVEDCITWLKVNYPNGSFYNKGKNCRTFIQYLEHMQMKLGRGLGYWDDSPRFFRSDAWPAMIRKSMIMAVHPVYDRYLIVRDDASHGIADGFHER